MTKTKNNTDHPDYFTLNDLAKKFEVSITTLRKRMQENILVPNVKTTRGYLFLKTDVEKLDKKEIVRKFKFSAGYRRDIAQPTEKELLQLEEYVVDGDRRKMSKRLGISRQRLSQRMMAIGYRWAYFEIQAKLSES